VPEYIIPPVPPDNAASSAAPLPSCAVSSKLVNVAVVFVVVVFVVVVAFVVVVYNEPLPFDVVVLDAARHVPVHLTECVVPVYWNNTFSKMYRNMSGTMTSKEL